MLMGLEFEKVGMFMVMVMVMFIGLEFSSE